jgi:hypothetical protein
MGAYLMGMRLVGVYLTGVHLTGVYLTGVYHNDFVTDCKTICVRNRSPDPSRLRLMLPRHQAQVG